ncbi:MAG: nitrate ABC transporter ATP-binding protein [Thermostichus sp. HHBFW_bins_43]
MKTQPYIEVDHIDKSFLLGNGELYPALKGIHLEIQKGEFVSLIGHSGCGKSTLLNIIAGLDKPSQGGILLEGRQVRDPGPERMVVFQNYSLLPWLTVRENIALAVDEVLGSQPKAQRQQIVEEHIRRVGLQAAADKRPAHLSGGMKQRVAIARALAIRPRVLLLDEPFGALDALTRGNLQEQLMDIAQAEHLTCVMVTHDVDEALLLSDRVVMLTNGPAAQIGQILSVPFPRPRHRLEVVNHPDYYSLRGEMIYFLNQQKRAKKKTPIRVAVAKHGLEKVNLEIGFVPLTDCAPLVVAKEKGFFQKYGLEDITLVREPGWKILAEGIRSGRLDAAAAVAGIPLASTLGVGGTPVPLVTALTLSRGGNAITLGHKFLQQGIQTLEDFRQYLNQTPDKVHTLGMVHPVSMHNFLLRHWLASGGIHPDQEVTLTVIPPPQMVSNLKAGNIDGYCVGEPWNSRAVREQVGFIITTTPEILPSHIEKVLTVRQEWAQKYPRTHIALVKALLEACEYCDQPRHRPEIIEWLAQPHYVGVATEDLQPGLMGTLQRGIQDESQVIVGFNQFANGRNTCPEKLENLWILTQMARWGICAFPRNWISVIDQVLDTETYALAARELGLPDRAHDRGALLFADGSRFDGQDPLGYLESVPIRQELQLQDYRLSNPVLA